MKYKRIEIQITKEKIKIHPILGYCNIKKERIDSFSCWDCGGGDCKRKNFSPFVYRNLKKTH